MSLSAERWDVFCKVVDNYGDAGVAWRLARQLAGEHGKQVRLWLADVALLAKLRPGIDASRDTQRVDGVEIARWREAFAPEDVADVVLETFGCDPPEAYVLAMAGAHFRPRWINLEYLSAEDWVAGSHALPSPHPRLPPLVKHYFFPGFTLRTGGLLREAGLFEKRDAFQSDAAAQNAFWREVAGSEPPANALKLSLFAYPGAPVQALFDVLAAHPHPVWCAVAEGTAGEVLREPLHRRGSLEARRIAFLPQDRYDELLWACDVNFVRGEDSFVRAQWAARPFVWHIYPQDEGAHAIKLDAFLARFGAALDRRDAASVTDLWHAWNRSQPLAAPWQAFVDRLDATRAHVADWAKRQGSRRGLAAELVDFADNVLK